MLPRDTRNSDMTPTVVLPNTRVARPVTRARGIPPRGAVAHTPRHNARHHRNRHPVSPRNRHARQQILQRP